MYKGIFTKNIKKDISNMMSFLKEKDKSKYSLSNLKYLNIPEDVLLEINARRDLTVTYIPIKDAIEINAYNEDYHNGNSHQDYWFTVELRDYTDDKLILILELVRKNLYIKCFNKEREKIIKDLVNISLSKKLNIR